MSQATRKRYRSDATRVEQEVDLNGDNDTEIEESYNVSKNVKDEKTRDLIEKLFDQAESAGISLCLIAKQGKYSIKVNGKFKGLNTYNCTPLGDFISQVSEEEGDDDEEEEEENAKSVGKDENGDKKEGQEDEKSEEEGEEEDDGL